jgi:hypothetical protein
MAVEAAGGFPSRAWGDARGGAGGFRGHAASGSRQWGAAAGAHEGDVAAGATTPSSQAVAAAAVAAVSPSAHLASFARERVTFLSVCDGWVVAQTASGLAVAFPMALPPDAPLAALLQPHHRPQRRHPAADDAQPRHAEPAALAAPPPRAAAWPVIHLNLRPGHVVHCTYLNPRSRPGPTLITCVSDETFHLRCFATPLCALRGGQAVVEAVTTPVFTEDAFRHPGFVEANSVNNTALTYGCAAGAANEDGMRYRVWELDGYTPVVTVPDAGVVDVK